MGTTKIHWDYQHFPQMCFYQTAKKILYMSTITLHIKQCTFNFSVLQLINSELAESFFINF